MELPNGIAHTPVDYEHSIRAGNQDRTGDEHHVTVMNNSERINQSSVGNPGFPDQLINPRAVDSGEVVGQERVPVLAGRVALVRSPTTFREE